MKHNLEPEPQTYSTIGGYLSEEHSDLDPKIQLLSAYLDNEATVAERRQVQLWLDTDPLLLVLRYKN
ncbi:hypothetical protein L2E81_06515 [Planktothrix agardhii 1033]|nr:hypothetical protein [Planktothrix agardhii 1033]